MLLEQDHNLKDRLKEVHKKHPPQMRIQFAKTQQEAARTLATKSVGPSQYLTWLPMLEKAVTIQVKTLGPVECWSPDFKPEDRLVQTVCKTFKRRGIPIVGEVLQQMHGPALCTFMHYDFGRDLSLSEKAVLDTTAKERAQNLGWRLGFGLYSLTYSLDEPINRFDD